MNSLRFLLAAATSLPLSACFGFDLGWDVDRDARWGEEHELAFAAYSNDPACSPDCPELPTFLVGGASDVAVYETDPQERISVRFRAGADGRAALHERISCSSDREIAFDEACPEGETRFVTRSIEITPLREGALPLEVLDADGDVIDHITITAKRHALFEVRATTLDAFFVAETTAPVRSTTLVPGADAVPLLPSQAYLFSFSARDADGGFLSFDRLPGGLGSDDDVAAAPRPFADHFLVYTGDAGSTNLWLDLAGERLDVPVVLTAE